jgi:hypothetical protein
MKDFPFSKDLFWDTDIRSINFKKHKRYIIERVLTRGSKKDFEKLLSLYHKKVIGFALRMSTELDPKTRQFCSKYFNIPIEEMYVSEYYTG